MKSIGDAPDALGDELALFAEDLRQSLSDAVMRGVSWESLDSIQTAAPAAPMRHNLETDRVVRVHSAWTEIADEARTLSDLPATHGREALQKVRGDLGECRRCGLCEGRNEIVFGVGDPTADLMVIGEVPGQEEDLSGEPFIGPGGQMLDRMLLNVLRLGRSQVYITNIVKCRPSEGRSPSVEEVSACKPFLEQQIAAVQPRLILVLGALAVKAMFGLEIGIKASRGRWREWRGVPVMATFHPDYLLRNADEKRWAFEDLKLVCTRYDELGGRR